MLLEPQFTAKSRSAAILASGRSEKDEVGLGGERLAPASTVTSRYGPRTQLEKLRA